MLPSSEKKSTQDHLARQTKARNDKLELQDRLKVSGYVQQQVQQKQQQLNNNKTEQREMSPKPDHASKYHVSADSDRVQSPQNPHRSQQPTSSSNTGPAPSKQDTSRRTQQQSPPRRQQSPPKQQSQSQSQQSSHQHMTTTSSMSAIPPSTSSAPSTHPATTHSSATTTATALTTNNIHIVELLEKERREWQQERLKLVHCIHLQQIELAQRATLAQDRATDIAQDFARVIEGFEERLVAMETNVQKELGALKTIAEAIRATMDPH